MMTVGLTRWLNDLNGSNCFLAGLEWDADDGMFFVSIRDGSVPNDMLFFFSELGHEDPVTYWMEWSSAKDRVQARSLALRHWADQLNETIAADAWRHRHKK